ncbi:unnamed protein product [Didymodactylos carnosus]|uniref:CASTOR ACT domain-containing protein n=1 Tax=Didymodactylos carnosus TaxID=1234261 RepID=A0A814L9N0_9BILA|nr:unnamed protein product [Didymodactylos carnosus]CAF1221911.1 unnamed protein product [Didymodactylos carnosus]CAF3828784.1 unnamed protein product [Didymodactylos carnosus]CAF4029999.1 unnamed protein product [Didymodactylos carnosus]
MNQDVCLKLVILPDQFSICRLSTTDIVPEWAYTGSFVSITRTADELSIVTKQENVPNGIQQESGWKCFKIQGPLAFSMSGVLSSLLEPLAVEKVSIFAISTYDTDYLLVKQTSLQLAVEILRRNGHSIDEIPSQTSSSNTVTQ